MKQEMRTVEYGNDNFATNSDLFEERYYNLNKRLLHLVGIWPYQSIFDTTVRVVGIILVCSTLLIPQLLKIAAVATEYSLFIGCLPPLSTHLGCLMKLIHTIIFRKPLTELLNRTQANWKKWSQAPEIMILQKYGETGRNCSIYYFVTLYAATIAYVLTPSIPIVMDLIAPLNISRPRIVYIPVDYKIDPEKYYNSIYLHGVIVTVPSMIMLVGADTLHMAMAQHACGMFDIVRYNLENIIREDEPIQSDMFEPILREDISYKKIIPCIETHRSAMKYVRLMESANEWGLILIIIVGVYVIAACGSRLVAPETSLEDSIRFVGYILATIAHIFCNTLPGHWISVSSARVRDSAYNAPWYIMSRRSRGLILILLRQTMKPCTITAGRFYVMSMENFSRVLKTSMSYFTLLNSA